MGTPEQITLAALITAPFEGFRSKPYICPAGYPTVGYGRRIPTLDHPAVTEGQARAMLHADLETAWRGSTRSCPDLASARVFRGAAITDFVYNLGAGRLWSSTLRRKVNARDWQAAGKEMRRWVYAGGRKLRGLVLRREIAALWLEAGD